VLEKYIQAIGGLEKINKINSFEQEGKMNMGPMALEMKIKGKDGGKLNMSVLMGGNPVMKTICNGKKACMEAMGQKTYPEGNELTQLRMQSDMKAEMHYQDYGITPVLKGIANLDGKEYFVVELKDAEGGMVSTDYFDVATGLRYKTVVEEEGTLAESVIKEYAEFEGIKLPSLVSLQNGSMEIVTTKVTWNVKIDDKEFVVE
jgi:hypothetical protein